MAKSYRLRKSKEVKEALQNMQADMLKRANESVPDKTPKTLPSPAPDFAQAQEKAKAVHVVGKFYTAPEDAKDVNGEKLRLTYDEAEEYVSQKNKENYLGHSNWYIASVYDWQSLCNNKDHPGLTGTFNQSSKNPEDDYWTSTREDRDYYRSAFVHTCHFDSGDGWGAVCSISGGDKRTVRLARYENF